MLRRESAGESRMGKAAGGLAVGYQALPGRAVKRAKGSAGSGRRAGRHAGSRRACFECLEPRLLLSIGPQEQFFAYLLNRARHDPVAYQQEQGLSVDLSYVEPRPPLAVNDHLFASSGFHAEEMATYNYFGHQSQVTGDWPNKMARDHGYVLPASWIDEANYIESAAAGYTTVTSTLNGLIVDAGINPPGHRNHLLGIGSFNADNREIGIGYAYNAAATYRHYWAIHATRTDPADQFLTGVAYNDLNGNQRYDLNEGLSGVTISAGGQAATTNAQGGWSLPMPDGTYLVSASGGSLAGAAAVPVVVNGASVEVDFLSGLSTGYVNFDLWVNTAPAIDGGVEPTLGAVLMNAADPPGDMVAGVVGDSITDPDPAALEGIAVSGLSGTANGVWQFSTSAGAAWTAIGTVSGDSALLLRDTDLLRFVPNTGFTGTATITYHAWDQTAGAAGERVNLSLGSGGSTAYSTGTQTATVHVLAANTAPTLSTGVRTLTPVPEDSAAPSGDTVSQMVGTTITDPDPGASVGVAVLALDGTSNGSWQYSLDAGASWTGFGSVSASVARLLREVDGIRFVPNADFNGTATISYRAWDRTSGSVGGTADLSSPGAVGGTAAFSSETATAAVTVTPVNDAPVLDANNHPVLTPVPMNATWPVGDTVANIVSGVITDVDPNALQGIAMIGVTGSGQWYFQTTGSWFSGTISPTFAIILRAVDKVKFIPNSGFTGTATFTFRAWDQTTGSVADTWANVSTPDRVGGTTAFSAATATATVTVFGSNTAPTLDTSGSLVLEPIAADDVNNAGTLVSGLLASAGGDRITDPDPGAIEGIAVVGVVNANGTWQYSTNNGSSWSDFGTPSNSAARLLAADAGTRVRFVPQAGFTGTVSGGLTFRAWDRTSGTYGGTANTSPNGGSTAFSTATESAGITVTPSTLQVTGFAATASGFVAQFNRDLDSSVLNLYDGAGGGLGPADVTVVGATQGAVRGSLSVSADRRQMAFVQTGGLLEPDTYTVTLFSGAARFRDPNGETLDGNADGTTGDDYQTTFTVTARPAGTVTIRLPDIARGAGQPVNVPSGSAGLPVGLSEATGVTSLAVDLRYDPALLSVTGATLTAGLPAGWSVGLDTGTIGVAKITASGSTPLSGTDLEVVRLTAAVPSAAPYGAVQAIRLENVSVNGGSMPAVGDVAVHKAVYLGDADGSGIHSSADAFLTVQAALGLASGFAAHAWTDPRIVGDADGSGVLSAADAFLIVQEGLGLAEPFVPDNPHIAVTHVGGGVDPQFQIDVNIPASSDGLVTVPVRLDIEAAATNVGAFEFELFFDPSRLTIQLPGGVSAGADTAGWAVSAVLVAPGQLRVGMVSSRGRPLAAGLREIARLLFRVEPSGMGLRLVQDGSVPQDSGDLRSAVSARSGDARRTRQPVPDGLPTRPTLLPPITDHRLPITDLLDGSETHSTVLDVEPVDPRAGGYTWTDADGSVQIWPAERALAGATRERVWRDVDAKTDLLEDVLANLVHDLASGWR